MAKILNADIDITLGGENASNEAISSQKAIKSYVDNSIKNSTITFTQGGVEKGSITLNQSTDETIALDAGGGGTTVTVDDTLSTTSENPVQNKVITAALNNKSSVVIVDWRS